MTPRQLKYFIEIARTRSFTRAAGVLHVAQPALSRQESNSSRLLTRVAQIGWARAVLPYSAAAELLSQGRLSANPIQGLDISWMFVSDRLRTSNSVESVQAVLCEQVRARVDSGEWPGAVLLM